MMENNEYHVTDISIRRLTEQDAEAVMEVISEAAAVYRTASGIQKDQLEAGNEGIQVIQNLISSSPFWGAEMKGQIIGTIRLTFPRISEFLSSDICESIGIPIEKHVCYISRFYVKPALHGLGIGQKLIYLAEREASQKGAGGIALHSAVLNQNMVQFYKKRGFQIVFSESSRGYARGTFFKFHKTQ